VAPPNLFLARLAEFVPVFDAGRAAHPNVWMTVAAGGRESYPHPLHLYMRAHASVWRRLEGRPQPDPSNPEHGSRPPILLRRRDESTPPAPPDRPPARPPRLDETAHLFGAIADIEAFAAAAESAGALLDPTAEYPPVSASLAGTALYSAPLARWIGRVYATLKQCRPALICRPAPTPDGIELYVLDLDPWEASLLTIRVLTGALADVPGVGAAKPAAAEAGPLASSSLNEVGIRAVPPMSGDQFDPVRLHDQCLAASAAAAEAGEADRRYWQGEERRNAVHRALCRLQDHTCPDALREALADPQAAPAFLTAWAELVMDFAGALAAFPADADRLEGPALESEADQYARDILRAAVRQEEGRVRELLMAAWGTRPLILGVNDALRDRIPDALMCPKPPVRIDAAAVPPPAGVSAVSSDALDAAFRLVLEAETTPPVEVILALGRAVAEARLYDLLRECPNPGGGLLDAATRLHLPLTHVERARVNDEAYVSGQLERFKEAGPGEADSWLHARDNLRRFKKRVDRELEERAWPPESQTPAIRRGAARLQIDGSTVLLDGSPVPLGMTEESRSAAVCYLTHLLAAHGDWRSGTELDEMEKRGPCKDHIDVRWDRIRKRLPTCLFDLTETDRRKGHRLSPAAWHR
jgi:hypothetical protein